MQDVPLPFELPPPDPTPSRPSRPTHVVVDDEPPTPRQHTDLPLPLCGNSGSNRRAVHVAEAATLVQLLDRLDQLLALPAAPSLHEADRGAVERWVKKAAAGIAIRREGLKLIQQVERELGDEITTALRIDWANERIARKLTVAEEREAGTYWQRRDASRRAKQPTHVDVDPAGWRRAKALASKRGMTIGHFVGTLVKRAAERGIPDVDAYATTGHVFARVDVDKPKWDSFKARCHGQAISCARGVGVLVEVAARRVGLDPEDRESSGSG